MKRLFLLLSLGLMTVSSLAGCYATGKATGEAADEIQQGADNFGQGYEAGKNNR